jgi:hypothetical protein
MAFARQPRLLQTLTTAVLNETLNFPKILWTLQGLIDRTDLFWRLGLAGGKARPRCAG